MGKNPAVLVQSEHLHGGRINRRFAPALIVATLACVAGFALPATASADLAFSSPVDGGLYQSPPTFDGERSLDPDLDPTTTVNISSPTQWQSCDPTIDCTYLGTIERSYTPLEEAGNVDEWGPEPAPANSFFPAYLPFGNATTPGMPDGHFIAEAKQPGVLGPDATVTISFDVDSVAPNTTFTSSPAQFSQDTSPTFGFTMNDPAPSSGAGTPKFMCNLDGAGFSACETGDEFTTPEGNHTLQVKAIDLAGNEDPTPASYSWMVDLTPPVLTINQPLSKGRYLLHQVPVNVNCTDPLAGGPPPVASGVPSSGPGACTSTPVNQEVLSPHKFTLTATDRAGNSSSKSIAYVVDPPDYGNFIKQSGPLAYYRLDETVGSADMIDRSGNGHNGIYQNGIALGRDGATSCERRPHPPRACELDHPAENKAGYFPPRDGHGYVNGIAAPTTAYTMEAWVKPADSADMMVMSHGGGGQLFIKDGKLAFRQVQDTIHSNGAVASGVWSHVAATWNGSTTRLYVNGVQVASSNSANKTPSGISTFYVGYGEMAPWFHGDLDEVVYYSRALNAHAFQDRRKIGVAKDNPSVERGNSELNTEGPFTDPSAPKNNGLYAPTKVPVAEFTCTDPDDLPGDSDVDSCTATVDGSPISSGDALPDSIGNHVFIVTAIDKGGNTYVHQHSYSVKTFKDLYNTDSPIAYYRLGEASGSAMADSSANGRHGEYKNDQDSGPVGISGDGDRARNFFGAGGYGYVNGIAAPKYQSTLEAWVKPADGRNQAILGHGDAGEIYIRDGFFHFRHMDKTVTSSVPVAVGIFQQVVGTWDGVHIRIYVDGIEAGKVEQTKRPSSISTFYVGYGELAPWFRGSIDEVAYYGTALPAARVYQHWLADPPAEGDEGPPVDFDEPVSSNDPQQTGTPGDGSSAGHGKGAESSSSARCVKAKKAVKKAKARHKKAKKNGFRKKARRTGKKLAKKRSFARSAC
ncbi:MAG: LamG domain-containing protein [Solirubrobacterales bacterium]